MTKRSLYSIDTLRELLYFGMVGGIQYVVDVGTFSCLVLWSGYPILSNMVSRALGATCGYYLNGVFTFRVLGRRRGGFGARFVMAWLITTAVSTGLIKTLSLLSEVVQRPVLLLYAKASIELLLFIAGFLLCKLWVFAARDAGATDGSGIPGVEASTTPADSPSKTGKGILFVLAHPDDECFFSPRIKEAVDAGHAVYCAYTTDGGGHGVSPEIRMRESGNALALLGVPPQHLFFAGVTSGIRDGSSYMRIGDVYDAAYQSIGHLRIDEIYVMAWEGGHVDHDACHLVGVALARALGIERVYECPGYNRYRAIPFLFRVMKWIPRKAATSTCRFGLAEGLFFFSLCLCHRSQWKTWIGLGPEAFVRLVLRRRHDRRRVAGIDYTVRPHTGPLLYEKQFGISFDRFREATAPFVSERVQPPPSHSLTVVGP
ncbi:MAG: PIG-L family deacetylase [Phycisphaerae bacterium]|nr:PIG-L family deacetylase [Phycisphaerae bacterium]